MKGDRVHRDIQRDYTFHKDIGYTIDKCVALKEKFERLIRPGYFMEFVDELQDVNQED